jgi:hypothetical protein
MKFGLMCSKHYWVDVFLTKDESAKLESVQEALYKGNINQQAWDKLAFVEAIGSIINSKE